MQGEITSEQKFGGQRVYIRNICIVVTTVYCWDALVWLELNSSHASSDLAVIAQLGWGS